MSLLTEWESFYVIVGSSAGALIGLQFVVLTLLAERPTARMPELSATFATPSVVHFVVVLGISAMMSAPWHETTALSFIWGFVGAAGILYQVNVARRMRGQKVYQPVFEDWLFHVLLPVACYAMLVVSAVITSAHTRIALFVIGFSTLLFLFVGIHNAWDTVTWHVFTNKNRKHKR